MNAGNPRAVRLESNKRRYYEGLCDYYSKKFDFYAELLGKYSVEYLRNLESAAPAIVYLELYPFLHDAKDMTTLKERVRLAKGLIEIFQPIYYTESHRIVYECLINRNDIKQAETDVARINRTDMGSGSMNLTEALKRYRNMVGVLESIHLLPKYKFEFRVRKERVFDHSETGTATNRVWQKWDGVPGNSDRPGGFFTTESMPASYDVYRTEKKPDSIYLKRNWRRAKHVIAVIALAAATALGALWNTAYEGGYPPPQRLIIPSQSAELNRYELECKRNAGWTTHDDGYIRCAEAKFRKNHP